MQAVLRRQGGQTPGWDLTPREKEVLPLLVKGMTNDEIAERLILSTATVRLHVSNVLMKLHASNRTTAAVIAVENRLV
jgi:NarL family two-component system response regulator LiaR